MERTLNKASSEKKISFFHNTKPQNHSTKHRSGRFRVGKRRIMHNQLMELAATRGGDGHLLRWL